MLNLAPGVSVPPAASASSTAIRRLQKDYAKLMEDPVDGINALPNDENILEWHYCLRGSPDTPFQGGFYWGKVIFKENFPWSPPAITMITPNGRFAPNVRLCLSISDYHPESWNPGWTVSAILIGLHSFMNENQPAAGSIPGSPQEQRAYAAASKEFNVKYREFRRFFPAMVKEWTGVYPTPEEPNVAPTMLPEHATPQGVPVPTLQPRAPRAAFPFGGIAGAGNQMAAINALLPFGQVGGVVAPAAQAYAPLMRMVQEMGAAADDELGRLDAEAAQQNAAPHGPMYHDLAAIAAAQANERAFHEMQALRNAQMMHQQRVMAVMGNQPIPPHIAAPVNPIMMPMAPAPVLEPPQQRVLRPRPNAQQDEQNGRRVQMLARLGMDAEAAAQMEAMGRGARRAAVAASVGREEPNPADAPTAKRARRA